MLYYLFERYIISRDYSFYHAISKSTENDLVKCGVQNRLITTIYPGIKQRSIEPNEDGTSADHLQPAPDSSNNSKTFLYFGRPGKPKGIFILFDAIRAIRNQLPKGFRFVYILSNDP